MTTIPDLSATLADIQAKTAETLKVITPHGFVLDTSEWLTIARYAKKYNMPTQQVSKWIERGVIPADCVETLADLNNIKLVKDRPYR